MRAVWLREFGPPSVLEPGEAPDPALGPGGAVVATQFANVTFVETQVRSGRAPFPAPPLPVILGNGVGGVVTRIGAPADPAWLGKTVITSLGGSGGYAEQAAVDASQLIEVPTGLGLAQAVALLADGRTATAMIRTGQLRPGDRVFVLAAAGGVGTLLVQLAARAGAVVIGAAGTAQKTATAAELGAELTVDYRAPDWPATIRAQLGGVDVVFDGVGGAIGADAFDLLQPGGRMVSFGLASGAFTHVDESDAASREVLVLRGGPTGPDDALALTRSALAEAVAGRLRPIIGQRLPLDEAAAAHAGLESRATIGKTLLVVE
jgi:NADPH2:quinone reductase